MNKNIHPFLIEYKILNVGIHMERATAKQKLIVFWICIYSDKQNMHKKQPKYSKLKFYPRLMLASYFQYIIAGSRYW